ncbi:bystin-like [Actinidia eriantha]|uniref:bystin-like n=1 Tax=Actinidia eriantha TaxID=165200 RepID=UPI00258E67E8|nr:bystin-like [Actinidia eriantha]XP_057478442.1 bystin-like [Actinidia eriantha]XP_057478443.1 bystin-like [Actinidia eriantha]
MQSLSSMGKKRTRHQNPEPFLADENASSASENRNKPRKHHRQEDKLISSGMSSKIWKEAMIQQREVQEEAEGQNPIKQVFEEEVTNAAGLDEEDIDEFRGFSETQSHFGGYEEEIDEEDEKLLEAFMSKDAGPQRTLADLIVAKIKQKDAQVSSEVRPLHKLDDSIVELYKGVGRLLNKYTSGKIPKAFKHIPSLQQLWEEVLYLTEPEKWSPNAMYQATRIFASNLGVKKAERFYRLFLLPRVREDIRKNKRLHFALYQALKKSMYKPAAFNKGILFPLCESRTCNLREAVIIGSIIQNVRIPPRHSSFALLRLAEMEYCGTTSYFIKLLIEKKYDLPYRVIDAMVDHYMKFLEDDRIMPVIWHQLLLAYVQRYKNKLTKEDKVNLNLLVGNQSHKLVTPEILRELNNSRNRGEKEDDLMSIASPISVINKTIEEDRFDIPDVPMEED